MMAWQNAHVLQQAPLTVLVHMTIAVLCMACTLPCMTEWFKHLVDRLHVFHLTVIWLD